MRRLLTATVLVTALLTGAGCADDRPGTPDPTGSASAASSGAPQGSPSAAAGTPGGPAPTDTAPAGGNAREVCDAAVLAGTTAMQTYVAELGKMVAASGAGDSAGAEAARKRAEAALSGWRAALTTQSGRATDARLKALLTELAAEVGALKVDLASIDETQLDRLQQRLDQLCAG